MERRQHGRVGRRAQLRGLDTFGYDPDGARVKRTTTRTTSTYFGPLVEITQGRPIFYYFAGDRLIARRGGADVIYYTQDLTHSTRAVTDAAGNVVDRYDYTAFGRVLNTSENVPQDQEHAGGRHDDETGLTYLNARYYDAALMHFISADSISRTHLIRSPITATLNTQQDPINFWDPSGHMPRRVELKKELEAQSNVNWMAARSRAHDDCDGELGCRERTIPDGMEQLWAGLLTFNGRIAKAQAAIQAAERATAWSGTLSPPPMVTVEEADAPFIANGPDEWSKWSNVESAELNTRTLGETDQLNFGASVTLVGGPPDPISVRAFPKIL